MDVIPRLCHVLKIIADVEVENERSQWKTRTRNCSPINQHHTLGYNPEMIHRFFNSVCYPHICISIIPYTQHNHRLLFFHVVYYGCNSYSLIFQLLWRMVVLFWFLFLQFVIYQEIIKSYLFRVIRKCLSDGRNSSGTFQLQHMYFLILYILTQYYITIVVYDLRARLFQIIWLLPLFKSMITPLSFFWWSLIFFCVFPF